jgi:uncharacterized Zn finger protein (UPF0148 family)
MSDGSQHDFWTRRQIQSIERCIAELRALPLAGSAYTAYCPTCGGERTHNRFREDGAVACVVCGAMVTTTSTESP